MGKIGRRGGPFLPETRASESSAGFIRTLKANCLSPPTPLQPISSRAISGALVKNVPILFPIGVELSAAVFNGHDIGKRSIPLKRARHIDVTGNVCDHTHGTIIARSLRAVQSRAPLGHSRFGTRARRISSLLESLLPLCRQGAVTNALVRPRRMLLVPSARSRSGRLKKPPLCRERRPSSLTPRSLTEGTIKPLFHWECRHPRCSRRELRPAHRRQQHRTQENQPLHVVPPRPGDLTHFLPL